MNYHCAGYGHAWRYPNNGNPYCLTCGIEQVIQPSRADIKIARNSLLHTVAVLSVA